MNWKIIGKGFTYLSSFIIIPCSWFIIIYCFGQAFGELGYFFSFIGLVVFTLIHFLFEYGKAL